MKELESRDILRLTRFSKQARVANLFIPIPIVILNYSHVWEASIISKNILMFFGKKASEIESSYYEKFWVKIKSK